MKKTTETMNRRTDEQMNQVEAKEDLSLLDPKLAAAKASGLYPDGSRLKESLFKHVLSRKPS